MLNLSTLTDAQLENLEDFCTRKGRDDLHDQVLGEMRRRPDFVPSSPFVPTIATSTTPRT